LVVAVDHCYSHVGQRYRPCSIAAHTFGSSRTCQLSTPNSLSVNGQVS
jgi:hypothetical protein